MENTIAALFPLGFYWPFFWLFAMGVGLVLMEAEAGGFGERFNTFLTYVFLVFTVYVMCEYAERGHIWFPRAHFAIKAGAVIVVVGGLCLLSFGLGMILGNIVVWVWLTLAAIGRAIGGVVGTSSRFVWHWGLGPTLGFVGYIVRPLARKFRQIRRKPQSA